MPETQTLMTGLVVGESPRWHEGRLWFSNWGAQEIVAVDLEGESEVVVQGPKFAGFSIDWLPSGHLLVTGEEELLRKEADGSLVTHADLSELGAGWNEIVGGRPGQRLRQQHWLRLRRRGVPARHHRAGHAGRRGA